MSDIIFNFFIAPGILDKDKKNLSISGLDILGLKSMAYGKMSIFFKDQGEKIVLEPGIIDYLIEFKNVIKEIDSGNNETFSVSSDYYSNSLEYLHDPKNDKFIIYEVNDGAFEITTEYKAFRKAFLKFYQKALEKLVLQYPELRDNKAFIELKKG
ncbi:hypothetical protein [Microscilla marina]|uniref:Uncharacterized protein n=1 Tax=Microscilla marina ATCC 23134 TaxID=313606 RepID=A1ZUQ4_MICM2|nr:hypothetical protein [Microscilla marina]EAY25940.1 hypothetical protein M23134_00894 [Microscilla marina ATCC 23134]